MLICVPSRARALSRASAARFLLPVFLAPGLFRGGLWSVPAPVLWLPSVFAPRARRLRIFSRGLLRGPHLLAALPVVRPVSFRAGFGRRGGFTLCRRLFWRPLSPPLCRHPFSLASGDPPRCRGGDRAPSPFTLNVLTHIAINCAIRSARFAGPTRFHHRASSLLFLPVQTRWRSLSAMAA